VETDPSINEEVPEVDEVVFLDEPEANDLGLKQPHSKKKKSWVWEHFQKTAKKGDCLCLLCNENVWYSHSYSTNMLSRHIACHHLDVYNGYLREQASKISEQSSSCSKRTSSTSSLTTTTLSSWLVNCPTFKKSLVDFMVATYKSKFI